MRCFQPVLPLELAVLFLDGSLQQIAKLAKFLYRFRFHLAPQLAHDVTIQPAPWWAFPVPVGSLANSPFRAGREDCPLLPFGLRKNWLTTRIPMVVPATSAYTSRQEFCLGAREIVSHSEPRWNRFESLKKKSPCRGRDSLKQLLKGWRSASSIGRLQMSPRRPALLRGRTALVENAPCRLDPQSQSRVFSPWTVATSRFRLARPDATAHRPLRQPG